MISTPSALFSAALSTLPILLCFSLITAQFPTSPSLRLPIAKHAAHANVIPGVNTQLVLPHSAGHALTKREQRLKKKLELLEKRRKRLEKKKKERQERRGNKNKSKLSPSPSPSSSTTLAAYTSPSGTHSPSSSISVNISNDSSSGSSTSSATDNNTFASPSPSISPSASTSHPSLEGNTGPNPIPDLTPLASPLPSLLLSPSPSTSSSSSASPSPPSSTSFSPLISFSLSLLTVSPSSSPSSSSSFSVPFPYIPTRSPSPSLSPENSPQPLAPSPSPSYIFRKRPPRFRVPLDPKCKGVDTCVTIRKRDCRRCFARRTLRRMACMRFTAGLGDFAEKTGLFTTVAQWLLKRGLETDVVSDVEGDLYCRGFFELYIARTRQKKKASLDVGDRATFFAQGSGVYMRKFMRDGNESAAVATEVTYKDEGVGNYLNGNGSSSIPGVHVRRLYGARRIPIAAVHHIKSWKKLREAVIRRAVNQIRRVRGWNDAFSSDNIKLARVRKDGKHYIVIIDFNERFREF